MKKIIATVLIFASLSCKENLSNEIKDKIANKENFWENRDKIINKNQNIMEYPVKNNSVIAEERTNRIYIDNMECQFEIFVDDVLLFKIMGEVSKNGGGITGSYDINQLMLSSGNHEVKVRMYPKYGKKIFGKEGYVNMTFSHFKNRDLRTEQYIDKMNGHNGIEINQSSKQWIEKWDQETQVGYDGDYVAKSPERFEGLPIYEWRRTFDADVPFSFDGWRKSIDIQKEEKDEKKDIKKELFEQYKIIYEIIKNKDTSHYLTLVKEREDLITSCLYYKENEKKLRSDEFIKLIQSNDYELLPLFEETFQLEYQGYGKLAMLLHKADGEGIIRLKSKKDPNDNVFLDFRFQRKKKGDKLSII